MVYEQNGVRVTAFHVEHAKLAKLKDAFGFRVDYRGHAVVISADMAPNENFIEDAGRDFARIKPKLAVYTHFTRPRREDIREVSIAEIISRTRAIYSGPLAAGENLMSISIGDSVTVKRFGDRGCGRPQDPMEREK